MSEPTRYRVANNQAQLTLGGGILAVDPAGPLVEYSDYAALRMERIHDLNQIGGLQEENARLKAEVERLRKAGDWMCGLLRFDFVTKEWNAAKEGKQS